MEKELTQIFDNITQSLSSKKIKSEELKQFCNLVFDYAKQKLDINCNNLTIKKISADGYGYTLNENIVINEKYLKPKYLGELVHTIFHECRHIYQKQHSFIQKKINSNFEPSLPILHSNDFIYLFNEESIYLNPFYLYFTSKVERDADGYANVETYNLLRKLKLHFNQNKKILNNLNKQLDILKIKIDKNEQLYKSRLSQLKVFEKSYKSIIKKIAEEKLNQFQNSEKMFKIASAIFQLYTDPDITNLYFTYAISNKDTPVLFCVVNSPYSKIDNTMLNKFFDYCKLQNISLDEIQQNLYYWDKQVLTEKYNQINTPKPISEQDEIKQAKIKLYQSLESIDYEK